MDTQTEKPALTQTRCFKEDTSLIASISEILEARERAKFNSEHVLHRALLTLKRELSAPAA